MSMQGNGADLGVLTAAADLSTSQFRFVDVDTNGKAALVTAQGQRIYGVLQNKPLATNSATVRFHGVTKVVASAAIAAGADVSNATDGRAKVAVTGDRMHGIALKAAGGAGEVISMLIKPGGIK